MIHLDLRQPTQRSLLPTGADLHRTLVAAARDPVCLAWLGALLLLAAYAALLTHRLGAREEEVGAELARAAAAADSLHEARARAEGLRAEHERLERRRILIGQLEADRYALVRLMAGVAAQVPAGVWIDELEATGLNTESGAVEFRLAGYSPSAERTGVFERGLTDGATAAEVRLTGSSSVEVDGLALMRFELRGRTGGRHADAGYAVEDVLALMIPEDAP